MKLCTSYFEYTVLNYSKCPLHNLESELRYMTIFSIFGNTTAFKCGFKINNLLLNAFSAL
jgi:hypothetical protein